MPRSVTVASRSAPTAEPYTPPPAVNTNFDMNAVRKQVNGLDVYDYFALHGSEAGSPKPHDAAMRGGMAQDRAGDRTGIDARPAPVGLDLSQPIEHRSTDVDRHRSLITKYDGLPHFGVGWSSRGPRHRHARILDEKSDPDRRQAALLEMATRLEDRGPPTAASSPKYRQQQPAAGSASAYLRPGWNRRRDTCYPLREARRERLRREPPRLRDALRGGRMPQFDASSLTINEACFSSMITSHIRGHSRWLSFPRLLPRR